MRLIAAALLSLTLALPASAQQGWGNLDQMLLNALAPGEPLAGSYWLPDSVDPEAATTALGVVYPVIVGSAGSTGISVGVFNRSGSGWGMTTSVPGLFGLDPREHVILPDRIEVTTTMQGPGEPRCCPTLPVRWIIDRASGAVQRLN
ncbi:hypothetical protein [Oceaniglobus trochenteri]|uniref:hypothetical protein n=1 Tax=Oceaniglobus trochenteri TaxID=2763260 RepID=UPI001CFF78A2|nr:hypothetical protein [Oceaniglobus trochenteri]